MPSRGLQPQKKRQKTDDAHDGSGALTSPVDPSLYSAESRSSLKKVRGGGRLGRVSKKEPPARSGGAFGIVCGVDCAGGGPGPSVERTWGLSYPLSGPDRSRRTASGGVGPGL